MKKTEKDAISIEKIIIAIVCIAIFIFLYLEVYPEYLDYRAGKNVEYTSDYTGTNKKLFDHCWNRSHQISSTKTCFCKPYVASKIYDHPSTNYMYNKMVDYILNNEDLYSSKMNASDVAYMKEPVLANIAFKNCSASFDTHVKKKLFLGFIK